MTEKPPPEFSTWVAQASNIALARAVVEERQAYIPEALNSIANEVRRRALRPEELLSEFRRSRVHLLRGHRCRYVFGGLMLAVLGLLPGILPRLIELRFVVVVDNPTDGEITAEIGNLRLVVPAGGTRVVRVTHEGSEIPLAGWVRRSVFGESAVSASVAMSFLEEGDARHARPFEVRVSTGGRYLLCPSAGARYSIAEQRYRIEGTVARRFGEPREFPLTADGPLIDMDRISFPGRGPVQLHFIERGFPQLLKLAEEDGGAAILRRYRLTRE